MEKVAKKYKINQNPTDILLEENTKRKSSYERDPKHRAKKRWTNAVKQAISKKFHKTSLKSFAITQTRANKLKMVLATEKRTKSKCTCCKKPATFKHFCFQCPSTKMSRVALEKQLGVPKLTDDLLYYDKHSKRINIFIDKF